MDGMLVIKESLKFSRLVFLENYKYMRSTFNVGWPFIVILIKYPYRTDKIIPVSHSDDSIEIKISRINSDFKKEEIIAAVKPVHLNSIGFQAMLEFYHY